MPRLKVVQARQNWHGFSRVCHPVPPVSRLGVLEKHLAVLAVAVTMAGLGIPVKLLHEAARIPWAHDPEKQGKVINDTIIIYNYAKVETIEQIMVLLLTVIAADLDSRV
jgi:hypothetical protein